MNKLIILSLTVLVALGVPSCKKDDPVKYGVDGKTPLPKAVDLGPVVNGLRSIWVLPGSGSPVTTMPGASRIRSWIIHGLNTNGLISI